MTFRARILSLLALLLVAVFGVLIAVVNYTAEREAVDEIRTRFDRSAGLFRQIVTQQTEQASGFATLLAADYAFKRAFADTDEATLRSNLVSLRARSGADVIAVVATDGATTAALGPQGAVDATGAFATMILRAEEVGAERAEAYIPIAGRLHLFVFTPLLAPDLVAWVGLGHQVDDAFARQLREYASLEVVFLDANNPAQTAATLPAEQVLELGRNLPSYGADATIVRLSGERHLVTRSRLAGLEEAGAAVYVLASLDARLEPTRRLRARLVFVGAALLALALAAALGFARSISEPVQELAAHTARVAAGDYATRLNLRRGDELGRLAAAFNAMSAGLQERDRVRDLLDKNVSPEVAARLLREGAHLGGEERFVTVLFCDLRGFTTLAEGLPAPQLVTLLNRYLDRMSAAIEAEGGVVDKYIGDEIMALFGAPLDLPDAPDRAARAALAMRSALAVFNRELAAEGRPPLGFGIGIHTDRVVAGNIGSHRRLNYSVIGDGVNLAARLQPLTRRAEYATDIIVSEAVRRALTSTYQLRPLGETAVKGRAETVRIYALDAAEATAP